MNGNENVFASLGYVPSAVTMELGTESSNLGMPSSGSATNFIANNIGVNPFMPIEGSFVKEFQGSQASQQENFLFQYDKVDPSTSYAVPYSYIELEGYMASPQFGSPQIAFDFIKIVFVLDIPDPSSSTTQISPTFSDDLLNLNQTFTIYDPSNTFARYTVSATNHQWTVSLGIQSNNNGVLHFSYILM